MESSEVVEARIATAARNARRALLSERVPEGVWRGELSSSALSTATATIALLLAARSAEQRADADRWRELASAGRRWIAEHQNTDGGFGDTTDSPSNLSTTALCYAALGAGLAEQDAGSRQCSEAMSRWLEERVGPWDPEGLAQALAKVYGEDRTFAIPILVACAVSGAFGQGRGAWKPIAALPFELAVLPQGLFRFLGLPVVSYALPALIAVGQVIAHHRPSRNPAARLARGATRRTALRVLERIQPQGGGFLEATPLTSFVVMSLVASGEAAGPVVRSGLDFLVASVREDGSWPIDTDLATWITTLSIGALSPRGGLREALGESEQRALVRWLLDQQHRERHPYTGAAPGGWAWTELPGGVPDADDTPGALLALSELGADTPEVVAAASAGLKWLVDLQNRDGGTPTFCRGWGKLPFDQSCPDLTAHFLRACRAWEGRVSLDLRAARERGVRYLVNSQREDGAWVPLWFGNQHEPRTQNPVYGTSRVLRSAGERPSDPALDEAWSRACHRGASWLLAAQAATGGFGGAPQLEPSIEETGLALEALCDLAASESVQSDELIDAIRGASEWLCEATDEGTRFPTRPIGLYFAQLWYHEKLYPLVFCVSALERARAILSP